MKYQANKRSRINYGFIGITTRESGWWYHESTKQWMNHNMPYYESDGKGFSSHQDCNSVRAFRRKLKKCPKGVKFILVNKWVGYDVTAYNTTKNG